MDVRMIANILRLRRTLGYRERWTPEQLREHQQRELAALRIFTTERSPFYRQFHRGLAAAPLDELPVLTKATLMDHFDEISTDPVVRLADLQAYLDGLHGNERFAGRYWVSATSGSSGRRSIIPSDAREWAMTIASYARANQWAGIRAGLLHPMSMAVVSSTTSWHQSSRVAATVRSPFIRSERLDAAARIPDIVAQLNELRPDVLVAYASMIRALADEQIQGRLRIAPRAVNSSSEVLTAEARAMATHAWHVSPFNVYAATETGGIAAECHHHRGMHLFEDLVIPEVVDDAYRPVPPGQPGDRLLVTVLSSRTIPLIRYEMTDRVTLATEPCPDGLPFRLLASIEGRTDDVLVLPAAAGGGIRIHPVAFHRALDLIDAAGWQVRQGERDITVLVASPGLGFNQTATEEAVRAELTTAGARPATVSVTVVDTIPAGAAGKRPLVVVHHPTTSHLA
ncbi:putative adenylate-forming enzyme [Micromonospora purpureochromogenes]|uniref:Putative adenylate-forming enzyme n=1 Tax=Micromonospora purpureochromogenes TaxID=47872 RepID=A0A1C4XMA3_9ACTN|nr:phenylacetate--CoA ligase family protein [Micromonospora purpureochromogenes]SCF09598.1 putative adenylate-forming enzyme [Micromonospora purpureochromogenes]